MRTSRITAEALLQALVDACGNVTRAGFALGISKTHTMRLAARYELREEAAQMRADVGRKATGRPRG